MRECPYRVQGMWVNVGESKGRKMTVFSSLNARERASSPHTTKYKSIKTAKLKEDL